MRQKRQQNPRQKPDEVLWPDNLSDQEFDEMTKDFDWHELARFVSIVLERQHSKHEQPDEPTDKPVDR